LRSWIIGTCFHAQPIISLLSTNPKYWMQGLFLGGGAGTGIWTQSLMSVRQGRYHLSHASHPFCSGYFGDKVFVFGPGSSYFTLSAIAGMTSMLHLPFFCWDGLSKIVLTRLAWNCDLFDLSLPSC
jgi:hypothetical protein